VRWLNRFCPQLVTEEIDPVYSLKTSSFFLNGAAPTAFADLVEADSQTVYLHCALERSLF
jgi:hypothetical protein